MNITSRIARRIAVGGLAVISLGAGILPGSVTQSRAASTRIDEPVTTTTTAAAPPVEPAPVATTTTTAAAPQPKVRVHRAVPATTTTTAKPIAPRRPAAAAPTKHRSVLDVARSQIGQTGSYATGGFWCAKFASWVLAQAGYHVQNDSPGKLTLAISPTTSPRPGDLVYITFRPDRPQAEHVGIYVSTDADGTVHSIDGNYDSKTLVTEVAHAADTVVGYGDTHALPVGEAFDYVPPVEAICTVKPWVCE